MALVQSVATDSGGSGGTLTIGSGQGLVSPTVGNIVVVMAMGVGGVTSPTCSDNAAGGSNTYILQQSDQSGVNVSPCCMFTAIITKSGATTISLTGCVKTTMFVMEESGVSAVDLSNIAANQGNTSTPTTSVSTSQSSVISYSMACYGNGTLTYTQNSGTALPTGNGITTGQRNNTTAGASMFVQRQAATGPGTVNGTVTGSVAVTGSDSIIVTLTPTAAPTATIAWVS